MNGRKPSGGDKVGYCNPPKHSQFKRGQSGNPSGRPRGSRSLSAMVDEELERFVYIRNGQVREKMRAWQALIRVHMNKGMQGDVKSADFVAKHLSRNDAQITGAANSNAVPPLPDDDQKILDDYVARQRKLKTGGDDD